MTALFSLFYSSFLAQATVGAPSAVTPGPSASPQEGAVPPAAPPSTNSPPAPPIVNQPAAAPQGYPAAPPSPAPSATPPQGYPAAPPSPAPSYPATPYYYYPPPYYQGQPAMPPPGYGPAPAAGTASAPVTARPRFGVLVGGGYVPRYDVSGIAAGVTAIPFSTNGFETRLMLTGYRMYESGGHTNGLLAMAQEMKWWDRFGLGAGAGAGYAVYYSNHSDFTNGSGQVVGFVTPAAYRAGLGPWFEFGLIVGGTKSFDQSPAPFGYLYVAALF